MPQSERRSEAIWVESRARWQINVQKGGKRKTFTSSLTGKKGKHEAEAKADKWLENKSSPRRFEDAMDAFMADYETRVQTATFKALETLVRNWIRPNIKPRMDLADITPAVWQVCIDAAAKAGLSKKTCANIRGAITSFCTFCKRNRWDMDVPDTREILLPKNAPKGTRRIIQPTGMRTLFSESTIMRYEKPVECWYIHCWRLMVLTGLRRGEAAGLRWEDMENENVLHIRRSINKLNIMTDGKTENAQRYVTLSPVAQDILRNQRAMLLAHGIISPWIFPGRNGDVSDTNAIYKAWYTYRKQHGLECSLHELRHTFISAVKSDMPEALLKQQVGHSSNTDSIGIYGHEMDGDLDLTARIIDNVFKRLLG